MTANHCPDLATPQALYRRCCRRRRLRRRLPTSIRTTPLSLAPLSLAGMATESVATLSSEAPSAAEVSAQQQASGAAFLDGLEALCASAAPFLEQLAQQVRPVRGPVLLCVLRVMLQATCCHAYCSSAPTCCHTHHSPPPSFNAGRLCGQAAAAHCGAQAAPEPAGGRAAQAGGARRGGAAGPAEGARQAAAGRAGAGAAGGAAAESGSLSGLQPARADCTNFVVCSPACRFVLSVISVNEC